MASTSATKRSADEAGLAAPATTLSSPPVPASKDASSSSSSSSSKGAAAVAVSLPAAPADLSGDYSGGYAGYGAPAMYPAYAPYGGYMDPSYAYAAAAYYGHGAPMPGMGFGTALAAPVGPSLPAGFYAAAPDAAAALEAGQAAGAAGNTGQAEDGQKKKKAKKFVRAAGGEIWEDRTLAEWDDSDFRLFCGDLGPDCTDEILAKAFAKYPSFLKARMVMDKRTGKTKGYGFVSFKDPQDFSRALREMNGHVEVAKYRLLGVRTRDGGVGKYVGNRPVKLRKSNWKERLIENRDKEEAKQLQALKQQQMVPK